MKRDPRVRLYDILTSIAQIESYTANLTRTEFLSDLLIQDAVIRRLEVIGEAVKHLEASIEHTSLRFRGVRSLALATS